MPNARGGVHPGGSPKPLEPRRVGVGLAPRPQGAGPAPRRRGERGAPGSLRAEAEAFSPVKGLEPKQVGTGHDNRSVPIKRRGFLCKTGALALGAGPGLQLTALADAIKPGRPNATKLGWKISVQHYTYRRFSLFEALDKVAAVGLRHVEIRTNLKLDSKRPGMKSDENMPPEARKELKARLADRGISVPTVFADFNGKPDQAERIFACWKGFGTEIIVAEPPADAFDTLERLCEEHGMRLALHNHQKGQSKYWHPELVLEACRNRSQRLGACCDDGQWVRSGLDPVECLHQLKGRIISFHLKDVARKGDPHSPNTVIGQGQADNARTLNELKHLGYTGPVVIDFEHDTPALQEDMAKNIAFVEEQARQLLAD